MLNVYISFGRLMGIRKRVQTTVNCLALPRIATHTYRRIRNVCLDLNSGHQAAVTATTTTTATAVLLEEWNSKFWFDTATPNSNNNKKRSGTKCSKHWALKPLNVLLFHSFYFILTQDGRYSCICVCVCIFFIFLSISLCGMFALDGLGGGMTGFRGCSFFVVTCVLWLLNIFRINGIISCESFLHISILALERGAAAFSADRFSMSECEREREREW